jgi:hypothetical protein
MENIFDVHKKIIHTYFFDFFPNPIKSDLYDYLYNNLDIENYNTLRLDLKNALTINANGEYI